MNEDGTTMHVNTTNHCLLYAFGECNECNQLFIQKLMDNLKEQHSIIEECQGKLYYFLAHQARKLYLNKQFKAR